MDGTLVDSDTVVARVWRGWATDHGLDPDAVLAVAHGRQGHSTMAELLPDRPAGVNLAENRALLDLERADTEGIVPVAGAAAFLTAAASHRHALVTSADHDLMTTRMNAAGLPIPPILITAESVGASKPDPEGFLKGAAELGLDPADCIAFEDSGAGIAAARAAGMRVVGIGPRAADHHPTAHVRDLEEIRVETLPDGAGLRLHFTAA
jgi:sugar-phosphatase